MPTRRDDDCDGREKIGYFPLEKDQTYPVPFADRDYHRRDGQQVQCQSRVSESDGIESCGKEMCTTGTQTFQIKLGVFHSYLYK